MNNSNSEDIYNNAKSLMLRYRHIQDIDYRLRLIELILQNNPKLIEEHNQLYLKIINDKKKRKDIDAI